MEPVKLDELDATMRRYSEYHTHGYEGEYECEYEYDDQFTHNHAYARMESQKQNKPEEISNTCLSCNQIGSGALTFTIRIRSPT